MECILAERSHRGRTCANASQPIAAHQRQDPRLRVASSSSISATTKPLFVPAAATFVEKSSRYDQTCEEYCVRRRASPFAIVPPVKYQDQMLHQFQNLEYGAMIVRV